MARNSFFPLAGILENEKLHESGTNFVAMWESFWKVLRKTKSWKQLLETLLLITQLKMCLTSFSHVAMTIFLFSVPCLHVWNHNFKGGLKTGVHLKLSMSWRTCFNNKLEPKDMRYLRHCLTARWQKEARLVLMYSSYMGMLKGWKRWAFPFLLSWEPT